MLCAAGIRGKPGIVIISPATTTINSAPAESLISLIGIVWFSGAHLFLGSVLILYCVFAIQTGNSLKPSLSISSNFFNAIGEKVTLLALYISLQMVSILVLGDSFSSYKNFKFALPSSIILITSVARSFAPAPPLPQCSERTALTLFSEHTFITLSISF